MDPYSGHPDPFILRPEKIYYHVEVYSGRF